MKSKWYLFIMVLVLSTILVACGSDSEEASGDSGDSGETYTVATDNNFVPFEFMNEETGEMEGFDIDLIKAIAEEAGFNVEIESMKFDGVVAGMQSGRYDIGIAGMTITEERKETIDFSDPYYAGLMLAVSADNEEIKSADDLTGKKVGNRSGTTSEAYIKENHPDAELITFPGIVEAYMDLESGRLDAVMYDVPNVQYYVANDSEGLKTAGDILQGEQYGIAFPKDSELVEDVNEALQTLIDNGTYDDIYEKWFGERKYGTESSE
ncbi:glutamine ABC transporter substrate-binding protein [Halobacillus karajensis]|uniref:Glutamine-binding periplasmic protein n=1 Tax=Halobacillus karajensis TaxID=195088 RepID=A0A024P3E2_9BACI|nr:glutamine ABC transporter substrate-binding protein [Halobacillus karajensis]CDQ19159.1 Glutamine-binding periplasmic protein precursor [Halobacillus karajensis]CDQ22767.1 Glutamine-binding periplasmic protein precursor [Halobacillus karajensis]CDQ26249.1 Glutamine-binding periplasmic protein precursor [Halobacillus karajensis]